ncbi:hypothetical protein ANN_22307 [Periplaneta americana]|uniref:Uncharacterized protein n=1 Tax=Periplaneta americana TaxID=6978 RepID=A0ABQ8S821_PERAM|nr:hypothetical protein ANN_22307 [Periplaneta americana]
MGRTRDATQREPVDTHLYDIGPKDWQTQPRKTEDKIVNKEAFTLLIRLTTLYQRNVLSRMKNYRSTGGPLKLLYSRDDGYLHQQNPGQTFSEEDFRLGPGCDRIANLSADDDRNVLSVRISPRSSPRKSSQLANVLVR